MTKEWLELYHAVRIALMNAEMIPDPKMKGLTDTYSLTLDDIEAIERAMNKIDKLYSNNEMEGE